MDKKNRIEKSDSQDKLVDRISVIQTDSLANLSPKFINEIFSGLVSTMLDQSKYGTESFYDTAKAAKATIEALNPGDATQLIVAAQIASLHKTHQKILMLAQNENRIEQIQTYTNLAIKLSNSLMQQITLMNKLKNGHQQKVVIEHVSINGGQAVVGTINTTPTNPESKK